MPGEADAQGVPRSPASPRLRGPPGGLAPSPGGGGAAVCPHREGFLHLPLPRSPLPLPYRLLIWRERERKVGAATGSGLSRGRRKAVQRGHQGTWQREDLAVCLGWTWVAVEHGAWEWAPGRGWYVDALSGCQREAIALGGRGAEDGSISEGELPSDSPLGPSSSLNVPRKYCPKSVQKETCPSPSHSNLSPGPAGNGLASGAWEDARIPCG